MMHCLVFEIEYRAVSFIVAENPDSFISPHLCVAEFHDQWIECSFQVGLERFRLTLNKRLQAVETSHAELYIAILTQCKAARNSTFSRRRLQKIREVLDNQKQSFEPLQVFSDGWRRRGLEHRSCAYWQLLTSVNVPRDILWTISVAVSHKIAQLMQGGPQYHPSEVAG